MANRVPICFIFAFALSILASLPPRISGDESVAKEFVITLDQSNFHDTISKHNFIVAEFYDPGCGACVQLAPEYEKAASILSKHDPPVVLAKINIYDKKNKDLKDEYKVRVYPTIKMLRDGGKIVEDYQGPDKADGIVDYLKKQVGPVSSEIKSSDEATAFITEERVALVGVFPEFSGEEFDNFTVAAGKLRVEFDFAHTRDAKHLPLGDSSVTGPVVRLFKPFDERFVDFKDFNVEALKEFVEEHSTPIVIPFTRNPDNHHAVLEFFNGKHAKAILFLDAEGSESLKSKFYEAAKQLRQQGVRSMVGDKDISRNALEHFGLKEKQLPLILIVEKDGKKFLKSNLESDHISTWLKEYKDGTIDPFFKAQPIPETNNEPVKVVVRDNFQDIVFNSGKNVLLEIYAPWCSICKQFAPILEEVAVSYQNDADVIIAKLDGTANDIESEVFVSEGFPTVYFRSASGKVSLYVGEKTKEEVIEFIEKNRDKPAQQEQKAAEQEQVKDEQEKPAEQEYVKDEL